MTLVELSIQIFRLPPGFPFKTGITLEPVAPVAPLLPDDPVLPEAPLLPDAPVLPVAPVAPVVPFAPLDPVAPVAPPGPEAPGQLSVSEPNAAAMPVSFEFEIEIVDVLNVVLTT